MARAFPKELRDEVVAIAQKRDGETLEQIAKNFGVSPTALKSWLKKADSEGDPASKRPSNNVEVTELKKRNRILEQENEVLRRATAYFSQSVLPK